MTCVSRRDRADNVGIRWGEWGHRMGLCRLPERYRQEGVRQVALPYFGDSNDRDSEFFVYAAARIWNLLFEAVVGRAGSRFLEPPAGRAGGSRSTARERRHMATL